MNYLEVRGVVHEVACEHFASSGDGFRGLKLDLLCGGNVFLDPELPWKQHGLVVTCFWCIAHSNAWSVRHLDIKWKVEV